MRRLTTIILAAALLAPTSGLAMQKMRQPQRQTTKRRVKQTTAQTKTPLVTAVHLVITPTKAPLAGGKLKLSSGLLKEVAAGLENSARTAEVSGQAPGSVQGTKLAQRSNEKVDAAKRAEEEARRRAAQQRAWAD